MIYAAGLHVYQCPPVSVRFAQQYRNAVLLAYGTNRYC